MANGSGNFAITFNDTTCDCNSVDLVGSICNPGAAYNLTLTVPWQVVGTPLGLQHDIFAQLDINGDQATDSRDWQGGDPSDIVVVVSLPAMQVSVVRISIFLNGAPNPSIFADNPSPLTLTPLTPPP